VTTLLVVLLVGLTIATLVVLAVALVAATDRLRTTVDRLLGVRGAVEPQLDALREDAERARAHAERIRATPLRPAEETVTTDSTNGRDGLDD